MHKLLDLSKEALQNQLSLSTLEEIVQQPTVWVEAYEMLVERQEEIKLFLSKIDQDTRIIFTGAGSSAYVGDMCAPWLTKHIGRQFESIATTDIVSAPNTYLESETKTILVSFGRSGNSPESVAAYEVAEQVVQDLSHIIITCNKDGALSVRGEENERALVFNLPAATHDRGFAMTSSFSTMMFSALCIFQAERLVEMKQDVLTVSNAVDHLIKENHNEIHSLSKENVERVVYLGSGELKGIAQECSLKFLELTAGDIMATFETPLGFRHGPKSLINNNTCTIVCISNDSYTKQYDLDIVRELVSQKRSDRVVSLGFDRENLGEDNRFIFSKEAEHVTNLPVLSFLYVVWGQLLSFYTSFERGVTVDNPCPTGEVNRVVQGVTIYPLK